MNTPQEPIRLGSRMKFWHELTDDQRNMVIDYHIMGLRDDPWNTTAEYTQCLMEAFKRGENYTETLYDTLIDWWNTLNDEDQLGILGICLKCDKPEHEGECDATSR